MKHTPGPWKVEKWNGQVEEFRQKNVSAMSDGTSVATIQGDEDQPVQANAHLIATAPGLLEVLNSDILNLLLGLVEDTGSAKMWSLAKMWMDLRDDVIEKANEGK